MMETERFTEFYEFSKKLIKVQENTEWISASLDDISFQSISGANPFEALGGDELSTIGINLSGKTIPLRYTALTSVLLRAEISGNGIRRLLSSSPGKFVSHIQDYLDVKDKKKKKVKALVQDGKLSALHSAAYAELEMNDIFNIANDYVEDYSGSAFIMGSWNYESTEALYSIKDPFFTEPYNELLRKHFPETAGEPHVHLRVVSSDVAESAVRFYPYLLLDGTSIPIGGRSGVRHIGKVCLDNVSDKLEETFTAYRAACRSLAALADITVSNKKNVMISAAKHTHLPQKEASKFIEGFENEPSTALEIYTNLCQVLNVIKPSCSRHALMSYEEQLMRLITLSRKAWSDMDVSGVVAWKA